MNRIIYYVKAGDTLQQISELFRLPVEFIMAANNLKTTKIFPGMELIIPSPFYYVQQGDSIYSIAKMFRTLEMGIMELNQLKTDALEVGQKLRIPLYIEAEARNDVTNIYKWAGSQYPLLHTVIKGITLPVLHVLDDWYQVMIYDGKVGYMNKRDVNIYVHDGSRPIQSIVGFYTLKEGPALPSSYESFINNRRNISEVGFFTYRISRNNPSQVEKFGDFTDAYIESRIKEAHEGNVMALAVIHNLLYERGNQEVNKDVLAKVVRYDDTRTALINNIVALCKKHYFDGVNMDIEDAYEIDSENILKFYVELGNALKRENLYFSVSVPARYTTKNVNPFSNPYQYTPIGSTVDEFIVMLYNEHGWPGSGPGPVVGLPWMKQVLDYTTSTVPKQKVVAAVSVFGFDFNLKTGRAGYVTYKQAVDRAKKYNATIVYDEDSVTPKYDYVDENGDNHEVWYEDARSIKAKIRVAWAYGIKGIALWRLGMEDPAVWTMIEEDVVVSKI